MSSVEIIKKDVMKYGFPFNGLNTKYLLKLTKKKKIQDIKLIKIKIISLLKKSVSKAIGNKKKVALFLSGGIDSNGLAIILGEFFRDVEVIAYTASFHGNKIELISAKKIISKYPNIKLRKVTFPKKDIWKEIIKRIGRPITDGASIPLYYLALQAKKDNLDLVLTGDGNDELWCGYDWYHSLRKYKKKVPYLKKLGNFLESTELPKIKVLGQLMKYKNADDLLHEKYLFDLNTRIPYCWAEQRYNLIESFGLKLEMPYLSQPLIDLAYNIPMKLKLHKSNKWLLKEALSRFNKEMLNIKKREMGHPYKLPLGKHKKRILKIWKRGNDL